MRNVIFGGILGAVLVACGGAAETEAPPVAFCPRANFVEATEQAAERLALDYVIDCESPTAVRLTARETGECLADPEALCISACHELSCNSRDYPAPPLVDRIETAMLDAGF